MPVILISITAAMPILFDETNTDLSRRQAKGGSEHTPKVARKPTPILKNPQKMRVATKPDSESDPDHLMSPEECFAELAALRKQQRTRQRD
jgi:hypothetical protein